MARAIDVSDHVLYGAPVLPTRVNQENDVSGNAAKTDPDRKSFRRCPTNSAASERTEWADANRPGAPTDCFIEGPSFDADGNLYVVDIPFGRIFQDRAGQEMVAGGRI